MKGRKWSFTILLGVSAIMHSACSNYLIWGSLVVDWFGPTRFFAFPYLEDDV